MARFGFSSAQSMASMAAVATVLFAVLGVVCTEAYAFGPSPLRRSAAGTIRYSPTVKKASGGIHTQRENGSAVTLYLFPTPPSISAANHRQQRSPTRRSPSSPIRPGSLPRTASGSKTSLPAMSDSVLAASDTLPSFHTAHGLLSPEVVMRIADTQDELEMGAPLHKFLKMYKSHGPMACLPMFSDPCVLPELTRAMRDIA